MAVTAPPSVAALPTPPSTASPSTFDSRADSFLGALPAFQTENNAVAANVFANATDAAASAVAAAQQASASGVSASASASSANIAIAAAGATIWISGTTYAIGDVRYSPANSSIYRRLTSGAGTTDPSLDATNWALVGLLAPAHPAIKPSLLLDFANSQTFDSRITFTRASTATRTNAKGLIETVASGVPRIDYDPVTLACKGLLIEEARTNLLTYSEQFDNAAWVKSASTVTANATTAPDGTVTADKLEETATTAEHYVDYNTTTTSGVVYAFSVFVKASERTKVRLRSAVSFPDLATVFDLSTGTIYSSTNGAGNSGIVSVGSGWYRCWIIATANVTGAGIVRVQLSNDAGVSYAGVSGSGVYAWGAQLEAGAFPTSYQPSTETWTGRATSATYFNSSGLIALQSSGVARMNYNPLNLTVAPKLMLEAAATNLLMRSEEFDSGSWTKVNSTVTPNATQGPDGGASTADLQTVVATATTGVYQAVTISTNTTYTASVYFKAGTSPYLNLSFSDNLDSGCNGWVNVSTLATNTTPFGGWTVNAFTVVSVGNGWHRAALTCTSNGSDTSTTVYVSQANSSSTGTGTAGQTIYIWGAQLEAGFATSYIPTVASQVTRNADTSTSAQTDRVADVASMTGANFSSWYRQDEGSFVVEYSNENPGSAGYPSAWYVGDGTGSNRFGHSVSSGLKNVNYDGYAAGVSQFYLAHGTAPNVVKTSLAYKTNDIASAMNGSSVLTDNAAAIPAVNRLDIGWRTGGVTQINGHIARLAYYPKRLTNAELQALTA